MEETKKTEVEVVENNETETPAGTEEKKFTQAEIDAIISERLARESKKLEAELNIKLGDEITKLRGNNEKLLKELEENKIRQERAERTIKLKDLGVDADLIDYVLFKTNDDNLEEFIKNNPKVLAENFTNKGSNAEYAGTTPRRLEDAKTDAEYIKLRQEQAKK